MYSCFAGASCMESFSFLGGPVWVLCLLSSLTIGMLLSSCMICSMVRARAVMERSGGGVESSSL